MTNIIFPMVVAFLGLAAAGILTWQIKKEKVESEQARKIASYIREGAMAFLLKEYKIIAIFVIVIGILLAIFLGWQLSLAFVVGSLLSAVAGNIGMQIATISNVRTAVAAKRSLHDGLRVAFSSGSVMGLSVVSLGLFGIALLYWIFKDPAIIYGFGFGASSIALFARVGGGIYTKAADVGADIVGKIEHGIPEDDYRNPATIADNVGDNVGDVAGMGADLFESYVDSIIAAMVLGVAVVGIFGESAVWLPLTLASAGIIASLIGNLVIKLTKSGRPHKILNAGIFTSAGVMLVASFFITRLVSLDLFWAVISGLIGGLIIGFVTEYYTSTEYKPTQQVSEASVTGAATNIISGLALGMKSTIVPVVVVCIALFLADYFAGIYGIAIAAVGMLSTLGITLATDSYGPVADNAAGIAEMAGMGQEVRERCEELDAVGNTTAAIGKGFAIGSAALTALVLAVSYSEVVGLKVINLNDPLVMIGLFLGGLLPFVFSSLSMSAVGKAAYEIVNEVRRQFKEIPGIMEGTGKPDYAKCVEISTDSALRQMIAPALIAVVAPVLVGLFLGKAALGGLLSGSIVTGFLLAILMANAGGSWDNAKKHIEADNFGGKGSHSHKASVVGDTVGDPFKDTAGPSLNILIKLMSIVALIIAPLL